jgi:hypothetical protein
MADQFLCATYCMVKTMKLYMNAIRTELRSLYERISIPMQTLTSVTRLGNLPCDKRGRSSATGRRFSWANDLLSLRSNAIPVKKEYSVWQKKGNKKTSIVKLSLPFILLGASILKVFNTKLKKTAEIRRL